MPSSAANDSTSSASNPPRVFQGRSTLIDALRGIAAFSVACYHIHRYGPLPESAAPVIPSALAAWFEHGWIGVQVFFVISGFVIAYSVREAWVTPRYLLNYAFRRSIRLDPPYWTTIAFVLLLHWVFHLQLEFASPMDVPEPMHAPLSWKLVLAHMLYLQNILSESMGFENLSAGFWTLCIEVQFYLLYVVGQGVAQRISRRRQPTPGAASGRNLLIVFAPLALLSLFLWNLDQGGKTWQWIFSQWNAPRLAAAPPGRDFWITHFFCMFFLGALIWWTLDGKTSPRWLWGYVLLVAARLAWHWSLDLTIALGAGVLIYAAGRRGRLGTALNFRPLQYLGRISYSLYLIHFPVAHVVTTLGHHYLVVEGDVTPWAAALWLLLALAASLGVAHLMYTYIEAPSVRLATRFKPQQVLRT